MPSMLNIKKDELVVSGLGVVAAIGQGKTSFFSGLMSGLHPFQVMRRPGRQKDTTFIGAEIPTIDIPERLSKRILRTASLSGQAALVTLDEAWEEAKLCLVAPDRIGLIIGGSNLQQRELLQTQASYQTRAQFMPPTYGFAFLDSYLCGICTEQFGIKGPSFTVGGASASGQLAVLQAISLVKSGQVDVCIAMGALADLSYWEFQALRSLGAMGTDRYAKAPQQACRPFDRNRDGFIYGESCGAVVIERTDSALARHVEPYAALTGWALAMDGNRNPNPSLEGETRVIRQALEQAGLTPQAIDYVNPHGTGSAIGDEIELQALRDCNLCHVYINATKSLTGHGISAAGTVEMVTTLLQMKHSMLHPNCNLDDPIDPTYYWVPSQSISLTIRHALNVSIGFSGINTAICLSKG